MRTAVSLLISCALHVAVILSFIEAPPPARPPEPRRVEIELRQVEARRGPPVVQNKKRASKRPPPARTSAPVITSPMVDDGVRVTPPVGDELGERDGDFEPGSSGSAPPPPPPPDTRAEVLSIPRVEYPLEAREDGVEGVVRLFVVVDERGQVISVELREDPGFGLGEVARRALLRATFKPATHLGSAVRCSFEYLYRFELE
jgi:protein TonB